MKTIVKEYTASEITKRALQILHLSGFEVWRSNNVRAVRGRTFTGRKGASDIQGFERSSGKLVACEVKKIGDKLSEDQKDFLKIVSRLGAFAFVARQQGDKILIETFEDVINTINK